ncbi:MAG TPA: diguanylate cyclase, partial [Candidatus Baltobacteraceae bacterium]|nr:diguanylate cyclase [Candidatus Baltobacteraceae bacterium]
MVVLVDGDRDQRLARLLWLERIAARLPGALMAWDREHRFTLAAGAAFQRPNFTPDEMLGITLEEYLRRRGQYRPGLAERIFSALGGKRSVYEDRFGEKWYEVHAEPLPEPDGSVGGVLALALDITERKRAQRALNERDAVVHLAAREAPMLLQTRDAELRLTFLAGKLMREFGIDPQHAIGTRFEILPGTKEREHPIVRAHEHAMQGRSPDAVHFQHHGRIIEACVEPLRENGSGVIGTVSVWFDVTEEHRAELLLRQHFGQLELAASHTPSILWAADNDGIVTTLTGRAVSTLGWDPAQMIGKPVGEALAAAGNTDQSRVERLLAPLHTGAPISYETNWGDRFFSLHVKPVREGGGGVAGVVGIAYDVTEQKRAQEQSAYLANYDALTGLPNRTLLKDLLAQRIAVCEARGSYAGIVAIDLDHFKRINDSLGLDAGDAVLLAVSRRLERAAPAGSTVGRSSGDEFIIIVSEIDGANAVADIARSVLDAFEAPFEAQERELFVRASAGVSIFPADGKTTETLIARADAALLHAKQRGRNNVQFFHAGFHAAAMDRLQLETDLRHAVERDEL